MDRILPAGHLSLMLVLALAFAVPREAAAQVPVDDDGEPIGTYDEGDYASKGIAGAQIEDIIALTPTELEELVGPIALYPDDLLAVVLPASTYPLEIVQAARFLDELEQDETLKPDEDWDDSVVALLNYPEVVRMMNEDIDWTWRLGEAVVSQQADLIAAVETFRDRAYAAGNLESDDYQTVSKLDGAIEIEPADDEVIYVPYYDPEEVIAYQPEPVYAYYPQPRPVYYYPYPVSYAFPSRHFWGVTTAFTIGWGQRYVNVYHPSYWGHPYYGRYYYGHYYRRPSISIYNTWYVNNSHRHSQYRQRDGDVWRPRNRHRGARPGMHVRNRHYPPGYSDEQRGDVRTDDVSTSRGAAGSRQTNGSGTRTAANRNIGSRDGDRRAARTTGTRERAVRGDASDRPTPIRFRDRSKDTVRRSGYRSDSGRSLADSTTAYRPASGGPAKRETARRTRPERTLSGRTSSRGSDTGVNRTIRSPAGATRPDSRSRAPARAPANRDTRRRSGTRNHSAAPGHRTSVPSRSSGSTAALSHHRNYAAAPSRSSNRAATPPRSSNRAATPSRSRAASQSRSRTAAATKPRTTNRSASSGNKRTPRSNRQRRR